MHNIYLSSGIRLLILKIGILRFSINTKLAFMLAIVMDKNVTKIKISFLTIKIIGT